MQTIITLSCILGHRLHTSISCIHAQCCPALAEPGSGVPSLPCMGSAPGQRAGVTAAADWADSPTAWLTLLQPCQGLSELCHLWTLTRSCRSTLCRSKILGSLSFPLDLKETGYHWGQMRRSSWFLSFFLFFNRRFIKGFRTPNKKIFSSYYCRRRLILVEFQAVVLIVQGFVILFVYGKLAASSRSIKFW